MLASLTQTTTVWYIKCDACGQAGPTASSPAAAQTAAQAAGFEVYVAPTGTPKDGSIVALGPECVVAQKIPLPQPNTNTNTVTTTITSPGTPPVKVA